MLRRGNDSDLKLTTFHLLFLPLLLLLNLFLILLLFICLLLLLILCLSFNLCNLWCYLEGKQKTLEFVFKTLTYPLKGNEGKLAISQDSDWSLCLLNSHPIGNSSWSRACMWSEYWIWEWYLWGISILSWNVILNCKYTCIYIVYVAFCMNCCFFMKLPCAMVV